MRSAVEAGYVERSGQLLRYAPDERIGVVVVDSFPALGTLTAARFLEWVQSNPEGVVALPTGKTPEHFIKETHRFLKGWDAPATRTELENLGFNLTVKPDMRGLRFVQIDEFYPVNPRHQNSFYYYVQKYYVEGFGLDPARGLFIRCDEIGVPDGHTLESVWGDAGVDLGLRYRLAHGAREELQQRVIRSVDQWCGEYEDRIRGYGGIGFFLGGIGPDGHIGFNVRGSDMHSTTRLTEVNYETKAAAAGDLGGIEVAEERQVITIGLSTITHNPRAVAIVMAAGEAKSGVVADAIRHDRDVRYPATSLTSLEESRFYLTQGAAKQLTARGVARLEAAGSIDDQEIERILIDVSLGVGKRLVDLTRDDVAAHPYGGLLLRMSGQPVGELAQAVAQSLSARVEAGRTLPAGVRFLHTEPHHDDIMLGYMPFVVRTIRDHSSEHHFATLTSGFTSVTNAYMLKLCREMERTLDEERFDFARLLEEGYFGRDADRFEDYDVLRYLDGIAAEDEALKLEGTMRRFMRNLITVFDELEPTDIGDRVEELINYFETQYPGKKDLPHIQTLKGMVREWESACLWGYFGWDSRSVEDLRLGFYTGDIFTPEPQLRRDVEPVLELLRRTRPDYITLAFDPEGSGPDTHYKVMQSIAEALKLYQDETGREDITVLGYRNVWYRFHPSEATLFVPVSLNMLTLQHYSFMNTYISQRDASFPSYEHQGPFCELAQRIQVGQYEMLTTCLGREYFYEHESALIRATRGFVFVKTMTPGEFYQHSRELRRRAESA